MRPAVLSALVLLALAGCGSSDGTPSDAGDATVEGDGGVASDASIADDGGSDADSGACNPACPDDQRCLSNLCVSDPPPCGSEPNPDCDWGLDKDTCESNMGQWICSPTDSTMCNCSCLTNDYKCPCWKVTQCEGVCMSDAGLSAECEATSIGYCSETRPGPGYGCHCTLYQGAFAVGCGD